MKRDYSELAVFTEPIYMSSAFATFVIMSICVCLLARYRLKQSRIGFKLETKAFSSGRISDEELPWRNVQVSSVSCYFSVVFYCFLKNGSHCFVHQHMPSSHSPEIYLISYSCPGRRTMLCLLNILCTSLCIHNFSIRNLSGGSFCKNS